MSLMQRPQDIYLRSKKKTKSSKSAKLEQELCIRKSEGSRRRRACAHGWEKSVCTHTDLGQAFAFSLGLFPLGASMRLDELLPGRRHGTESTPPPTLMKTRKGVVRRADSEGTRRSPSWGKDSFLPPNKSRPEPGASKRQWRGTGGTKEQGVRSPSGNSPRRMPRVNLP